MSEVKIFDDFLGDPDAYRRKALAGEFRTYDFGGGETYHGISIPASGEVPLRLIGLYPALTPTLSFFRRSPAGQVEPHFIHTDIDMGDWTALLYLNPDPPAGDGTTFWMHLATGAHESAIPHERSVEGLSSDGWRARQTVSAKFNRLVMFPATYFHSRAIFDNWTAGDDARLTQVVFGKGVLP